MPRSSYRITVIVAALFSSVSICFAEVSGSVAQDRAAIAFVQRVGSQGLHALQWPEPQRTTAFQQLFETNFDVAGIARFALGQYARSLNQWQYSQYMPLFRDYAITSSIQKLSNYKSMEFHPTGSRPYGGDVLVTSQVISSGERQLAEIDWVVKNYNGRYLISDIVIEGISMRVAYRDSFAGIIERNGGHPEALLAVLRQMTDQGRYRSSTPYP